MIFHRCSRFAVLALLLVPVACSKSDPTSSPTQPSTSPPKVTTPEVVDEEMDSELAKKAEMRKKVSDALAELAKDNEERSARWTNELKDSAKALAEKKHRSVDAALTAVLKSPHRAPGNADRDPFRHPKETLKFFGLALDSNVIEMGAGRGWYTELLAPVVLQNGQLTVGMFDPDGPDDSMRTVYGVRTKAFLQQSDELYGEVKHFNLGEPDSVPLGPPNSADLVLAIREMHNWQRGGLMDGYLKRVVEVLAPGGTFGVVQHRAKADANPAESANKGYLPEAWVIEKVEAAGLKFVDKSEVNANPKDTKDYEGGVWTLPPSLSQGDTDKEKYTAIGESDRMTLRFVKPKTTP